MRILKRNLAFVLALVMALSLTVSAANVKDYKDANDITFVEAVDTLTALGILEGEDGVFNPTNTLTREQGAKIIAYLMLGQKAADNLTTATAPFNDVAANRWSAGYVRYCADKGIIGGYGNGNFGPNDQLTATQFAKMLLCAVGYGVNNEFVGPTWESAVNSMALKLGVFDGNLDVVLSAACTREEAALYAFNTLTGVMTVKYSKDAEEYYSGSVFNAAEKFDEDYTLAKSLYNLTSKATTDVFGRECHVWKKGTKEITAKYHDEADATYTKEVKSGTIYTDLGLSKTVQATVIRNGVEQNDMQIKKNLTATKIGGNGVLVEAYVDEDENVTLVVIDTYLAKVDADAEDGEVDVTIYGAAISSATFKTAVEYKKGDYVLVTVADKEVQSMVEAEQVTGKLDAVATSYVKLDGEKYSHSANLDKSADSDVYVVDYDSTMAVILDEYGYAIGLVVVEEEDSIDGYVLVTASQIREDDLLTNNAAVVKVMYLDGTGYEVLSLPTRVKDKVDQVKTNNGWVDIEDVAGKNTIAYGFYGYTIDEDDCIVLTDLDAKTEMEVLGGKVSFKKEQTGTVGTVTNKVINSATELVLVSEDDVDTVVGYKNINIDETKVDALVIFNGKIIEKIYVIDGATVTDDVYAYYNGGTYNGSKGTYVTLFVDGEAVNYLNKTGETLVKGAYIIETEGTNLTSAELVKNADTVEVVSAVKSLYFQTVDGDKEYYADDVKVFDVTDDGVESTVAKKDKVVFVYDKDTGLVKYVWIIGQSSTTVEEDEVIGDTAMTVTVNPANTAATVKVTGSTANVKVTAHVYKDGMYAQVGTVELENGEGVFTPVEDGNYIFKLWINDKIAETTEEAVRLVVGE